MRFLTPFFSIVLLFLSLVLLGQKDSEWKLIKNSNNIKAYIQKVPTSELKRVKVETVLKASLSELVAVIKDAKNHEDWVFLNKKAKVIEETDDFNWIYYGIADAPWPVDNRDFITTVCLEQNKTDYTITITSIAIPDYLPENKENVRIKHVKTIWIFNPIENGNINISLEMEVNPGGSIPIWLINMAVSKGPYKTVEGFIKEITSGKYQCLKLDYIKEFPINQ